MNAELLVTAGERAERDLPALLSLAVLRRDTVVFERYLHGGTDTTGFNVKSASKSVVSALVGIAEREGFLPDLDRRLATIFPEYFTREPAPARRMLGAVVARMDSSRRLITIRHLLTMTSGQLWEESRGAGQRVHHEQQPGSVRRGAADGGGAGRAVPLHDRRYAPPVRRAHPLDRSADPVVRRPVSLWSRWNVSKGWDVDPQGIAIGGAELFLTTRGMLRFGQLYYHEGRLDGAQIVPRDWVITSLTVHRTDVTDNFKRLIPGVAGYGYLWWPRTVAGVTLWCALGYGGQFIVIDRSRELVIAGTSALDARSPGTQKEMELVWKLLDELVLPAVEPGAK